MPPLDIFSPAFESFQSTKMKYSLDISGVAGFFGGDVALSAMGTVHIYRGRKWLGWYNSPGSYNIARSYGVLCRSRIWDGLYPGVNVDPARLFGLDGRDGSPYRGVFSGTRMAATGHLACLLMDKCKELTVSNDRIAKGKESQPCTVTVTTVQPRDSNAKQTTSPTLSHRLEHTISRTESRSAEGSTSAADPLLPKRTTIATESPVPKHSTTPTPSHSPPRLALRSSLTTFLSFIPISATIVTAIMCVLVAYDWYSFALILYGAIASGVCCLVIGSGKLELPHPKPASGVPPGDGILGATGNDVVLLLGPEEAVNVITRGKFSLTFSGQPQYHLIGFCAVLLTIQFLAQLLIIPLGTLFGQVMFLASLFASWAYTSFLSSIDRYSLQRDIVEKNVLEITHQKYKFGTRTAMVVYILLRLKHRPKATTAVLKRALDELLPNDTDVWTSWKGALVSHLSSEDWRQDLTLASVESWSKDLTEAQLKDSIESQSQVVPHSGDVIDSESKILIKALCASANDAIYFFEGEEQSDSE